MKQKQSRKSLLAVDSLNIELYGMITQKGILSNAISNGTETMAAVQALVFPKDNGTNSIILERVSKVIINTLRDKDESLAFFGHPISDAKFLIEAFRNISYAQYEDVISL